MALPNRQVDLRHLIIGGTEVAKSRKGVLTLPGPALPKHLHLTGLAERFRRLFAKVELDAKAVRSSRVIQARASQGFQDVQATSWPSDRTKSFAEGGGIREF
eukprot:g30304.t1